jgi:serine/threonine-protein kinase
VPQVVGSLKADAIQELKDAGYDVAVAPGLEFDATVPKDHVLRTDPSANTRLVRGKTVTIVISAGPQYYTIPPVRGQTPAQARETLQGAGPLTVAADIKQEASDNVPEGQATRTVPPAGTKVTSDRTVTIYVSTGPPIVDVPPIPQGTPFDQAKQTLKSSAGHFKAHEVDEFSDSVHAGEVILIDPSDQAPKGSTITVTVSKGPEFVQVPDIPVGTPIADAQHSLESVGLVADVIPVGGGTPVTVLTTDPGAGTSVRAGSTVHIYALTS